MYIDLNTLCISLDSSVKHISRTACMALSGTIENGLVLSNNADAKIIIYKDRIDFGRCLNTELDGVSGMVFPNFYKEYESIVYRFGSNMKCSLWSGTLDYVGILAPTKPDNIQLFNLIYPRFA